MIPKLRRIEDRKLLDSYHRMRCIVCNRHGCDPAHIKSRGAGGDDSYDNVLALCRRHHHEQHQHGHAHMVEKYHSYFLAIESRGWEIVDKKLRRK